MTIGELWDALQQYPDDTEVYVGFINGHSIDEEDGTDDRVQVPEA